MCNQPYWHGPLLIWRKNTVKSTIHFGFIIFYKTHTYSGEKCLEVDIYVLGRECDHIRASNALSPLAD